MLFIGAPIGLDAMDNKVNKSWDITHSLDTELLAQIGTLKVPKAERMNVARKGLDHAWWKASETYTVRLACVLKLIFPKTILITSTIPEEGKSMLASNMASIFGRHGHKTLLIGS